MLLGSVDEVARDVIKAEELVDYTVKEKLTDRLARRFGGLLGERIRQHDDAVQATLVSRVAKVACAMPTRQFEAQETGASMP